MMIRKSKRLRIETNEDIQQSINVPIENEIKKTFIAGLSLDAINKIVRNKILEAQKKQQEILNIINSKRKLLDNLSTQRSKLIMHANKRLDKLILKLKTKIQELVNKISIHLQNINNLNTKYLKPLSAHIEMGIKCVRDEMKADFRIVLNDKEINKVFYDISKTIKFDLDNYSQSQGKEIDYLKLSRRNRKKK